MVNKQQPKKIIPGHIGIIMGGNRAWARERNLPPHEGHAQGYVRLRVVPSWFFERGVKIVSVYAFSAANWDRSAEEINYLMKLVKYALEDDADAFEKRDFRVLFTGRIDDLPGDLPDLCTDAMDKTREKTEGLLNICLNYNGRAEIVDAVRKMVEHRVTPDQVHEGMVRKYLYRNDLPDPDMVIRTGGKQRLSGFKLWQAADSELLFMDKYWPEFEKADVGKVIEEYNKRLEVGVEA